MRDTGTVQLIIRCVGSSPSIGVVYGILWVLLDCLGVVLDGLIIALGGEGLISEPKLNVYIL